MTKLSLLVALKYSTCMFSFILEISYLILGCVLKGLTLFSLQIHKTWWCIQHTCKREKGTRHSKNLLLFISQCEAPALLLFLSPLSSPARQCLHAL